MQNYWNNPYTAIPSQQLQSQQMQRPLIDWVVGKASADAYPMAPNGKVMLMDSQEPVMYVKTSDSMGRPSIVIFDLVERTAAVAEPAAPKINKEELRSIIADEVKRQLSSYAKKGKKEVE